MPRRTHLKALSTATQQCSSHHTFKGCRTDLLVPADKLHLSCMIFSPLLSQLPFQSLHQPLQLLILGCQLLMFLGLQLQLQGQVEYLYVGKSSLP